jgi:hypothetical protein
MVIVEENNSCQHKNESEREKRRDRVSKADAVFLIKRALSKYLIVDLLALVLSYCEEG